MVLLKFKKMQKKQEDLCRFGLEFLNSYDRVFFKKKKNSRVTKFSKFKF